MENLTPSDYTVIVKNIPKGIKTDYKKELEHIFKFNSVEDVEINVSKIILVYDIDYFLELERKLGKAVIRKQKFLEENGFRTDDPAYEYFLSIFFFLFN